jgi:hypothetical protein
MRRLQHHGALYTRRMAICAKVGTNDKLPYQELVAYMKCSNGESVLSVPRNNYSSLEDCLNRDAPR